MTTVTTNTMTGINGTKLVFPFTFPYQNISDIKVEITRTPHSANATGNTTKTVLDSTKFILAPDAVNLTFSPIYPATDFQETTGAPKASTTGASGFTITGKVYRDTEATKLDATFYPGAAIRSSDLNDNFTQTLYTAQESKNSVVDVVDTADSSLLTSTTFVAKNTGTAESPTWVTRGNNGTDSTGAADAQKGMGHAITVAEAALPRTGGTMTGNIVLVAGDITAADIGNDQVNSQHYAAGSIDNEHLAANSVNTTQLVDGSITAAKLSDATVVTQAEQAAHNNSDTAFFTTKASDQRYFNVSTGDTIKDGDAFPDNDSSIATTAAINDRIIDLVDDVGGFWPIVNETSFPNANPDVNNGTGTIVSVGVLASTHTPDGSGVVSISNGTVGNSTVTITGCGTTVLAAGHGCLVETSAVLNQYTFHRLSPKSTEVTTVAGNTTNINTVAGNNANITTVAGVSANVTTVAGSIANVNTTATNIANVNTVGTNITTVNHYANEYQYAASADSPTTDPTTRRTGGSLVEGDLWFDTTANLLKAYNGSAWETAVASPNALILKSTVDAKGDLLTASANDTVIRTAVGTNHKMLKADSTATGGVSWDLIDSENIENGAIDVAHMAANSVDSDQYVDLSIDTAHIGNLQVTTAKIADDAVTADKLADSINTEIAANTAKNTNVTTDLSVTANGTSLTVVSSDGANASLPLADTDNWGVMSDEMFDKLDGIEASATADQTNAEIRAAVEAATDSNVFSDADHTKLNGIATSANNYAISADLLDEDDLATNSATKVASQQSIKAYITATSAPLASPTFTGTVAIPNVANLETAVVANTAKVTNATHTGEVTGATALTIADNIIDEANLKLDTSPTDGHVLKALASASGGMQWEAPSTASIDDGAVTTAKLAAGAVTTAKLAADAVDGTKLADNAIDSEHYTDGSIDNVHLAANSVDSDQYVDGSIDTVHLANDAVDSDKLADAIANQALTLNGCLIGHTASGSDNNIRLGSGALTNIDGGDRNIAIGDNALYTCDDYDFDNVAIGHNAAYECEGDKNIAIGSYALEGYCSASGVSNIAIGYKAANSVSSGDSNVAIGDEAGEAFGSGSHCIAIGSNALHQLYSNGSNGTIAIGTSAGETMTDGAVQSTLIGYQAGKAITTGDNNTSLGYQSLLAVTTGENNVAIGNETLKGAGDIDNNVAVGNLAARDCTSDGNVAIGPGAMTLGTSAGLNVYVGYTAGYGQGGGDYNTCIGAYSGQQAGHDNDTVNNNTALGYATLYNVESGGDSNVAIGYYAGLNLQDGGHNTLVGYQAGLDLTTGSTNVCVGNNAGGNITTGSDNVMVGDAAGLDITTGSNGVFIGKYAGYDTTSGSTVAIGYKSLYENVSGAYNTVLGYQAGYNCTGSGNTYIGTSAGYFNEEDPNDGEHGDNNTFLGFNSGWGVGVPPNVSLAYGSNCMLLGYNSQASATSVDNEITLGDNNITALRCQVALTVLSDERDKTDIVDLPVGLDFVNTLKPVKFKWETRDGANKDGTVRAGFIAQQLKSAQEDANADFLNLVYESNPDKLEATYDNLLPVLVQAVQDLSAQVNQLKEELELCRN